MRFDILKNIGTDIFFLAVFALLMTLALVVIGLAVY